MDILLQYFYGRDRDPSFVVEYFMGVFQVILKYTHILAEP